MTMLFLIVPHSFNYTPYLFYKNGSNQRSIIPVYGPCVYRESREGSLESTDWCGVVTIP
jgi:hypothetical protein